MPEMEHGDDTLSTLLVKEAVSRGMQSPMREPILEAVEESEGSGAMGGRALPLAGGLVGLGVAIGYLLGSSELDTDETPLEDVEAPDALEDVVEDSGESMAEMESEMDETGGSSRLLRLGLLIVGVVGLELLRRRRSGEDEEWEPIEEFEPATSATFDDEEEDEKADEDEDETAADEDAEAQANEETEE
ncbi:hypothetical protein EL22_14085 [Halostagnicola sp. A56]|uniref:hypothetical protein n=1 Tax=Halostagnicola sp. A56 TaxID=1495067 RepID=UPI0004A03461|nr:hypothetical protein [Halostagnicola sp. A56]KDE59974.1 hypothetical protein EL22_14085 [Halostagnicola sp. A56]